MDHGHRWKIYGVLDVFLRNCWKGVRDVLNLVRAHFNLIVFQKFEMGCNTILLSTFPGSPRPHCVLLFIRFSKF
jgi:hypothetical protein